MKIYVAAAADEASGVAFPQGRLGFFIGETGSLMSNVPLHARQGELMILFDNGYSGHGDAAVLARQTLQEIVYRGFSGLVADFEKPGAAFLSELIGAVEPLLVSRGKSLYVSEQYAPFTKQGKVLIPSAISGGSLKTRLGEAVDKWGAGRVVLECQRTREIFPLPSRSGCGTLISAGELRRIREKYRPACFFSTPLCAYYFTYRDETGKTRFVLFDDAVSIARKIETAASLGIGETFMVYAEVEDIFNDIIHRLPEK